MYLGRSKTVLTAQTCAQLEGLSTYQVLFFYFLDLGEPHVRAWLPWLLLISSSEEKLLLLLLLKRFSSLCLIMILSNLRWCFSLSFSNPEILSLMKLRVSVNVDIWLSATETAETEETGRPHPFPCTFSIYWMRKSIRLSKDSISPYTGDGYHVLLICTCFLASCSLVPREIRTVS